MALIISQKDNTVFIEGALDATNIKSFKKHFKFILKSYKKVTLDISKVTTIGTSALRSLKEMYKNGVLNNNMFFVVGKGSKKIYKDFQYQP